MKLNNQRGRFEAADHLDMELEFYSPLLKQAYALEQGWQDKSEIARDAASAFLADHLGRWGAHWRPEMKYFFTLNDKKASEFETGAPVSTRACATRRGSRHREWR